MIALTTDVLAEINGLSPATDCRCAGLSFWGAEVRRSTGSWMWNDLLVIADAATKTPIARRPGKSSPLVQELRDVRLEARVRSP
jgi:hypothetical protein